jgi:hypothetical protein
MHKITVYGLMAFLSCITVSNVQAQILKGKVTDYEGNTVPGAVIFIREIAQGIATDSRGEFQISIANGDYTCEISSLGYEKRSIPLTVDRPVTSISVILKNIMYELDGIVISADREDPACAIMRKAIAMAPYYRHQVKSYESEIYLKGSIKLNSVAKWIESKIDEMKVVKGSLFLMESHNEVIFTSPDRYERKVTAMSSSFPKDLINSSPLTLVTASIYDPEIKEMISPLSPNAFAYYRFALDGKAVEGEHVINKIRVIPKKNSILLMRGWLYIVDDSWNVQNMEMNFTKFGITERFTINCSEVMPSVFLPVAYSIDDSIHIRLAGLNVNAKYCSSIKYRKIDINRPPENVFNDGNTARANETLPVQTKTKKQLKAEQKLRKMMSKEKFSNRDAAKIAILMLETTESEESRKKRESPEISSPNSNVHLTIDSLAKSRDSAYWAQIRILPLQAEENASYEKKDSLNAKIKQIRELSDSRRNKSISQFGKIVLGAREDVGKNSRLTYSGLLGSVPEYNFVDGIWLGHKFVFEAGFTEKYSLKISPSAYYVTARKTVNWQTNGVFGYAPLKNGKFSVSGGNSTFDFNQTGGTSRLVNSLFSLYGAHNSIKFFQKRYIEISNRIDAANGFSVTASAGYAKRNVLENSMSYNFLGKEPSPNLPEGQTTPMQNNTLTKIAVQLEYTPHYRYRIREGRKQYVSSKYPTFTFNYEKGIATDSDRSASFDKAEFGIRQKIEFNAFSMLEYLAYAGTFLSSKRIYFPDFKHCNSNELFFTTNPLRNSFCMVNYSYSTDKSWLQMHLNYTSAYLFIKNIPFLQKFPLEESLHARTLFIPGTSYSEAGYSIGFAKIIEAGVFVGFKDGKYNATGFTLSLPVDF